MPESPEPNDHPPRSWPADWLNQIHHGDCLDLLAQLPDESVDLVVTSPPYNLRSGGRCRGWPGYDGYGDDRPHYEYVAWQQECLREMYRVIKPTGAIFYNHAPRIHKGVQWRHEDILEPFDVRQTVIWHRAGGVNHNPQYLSPSYEYIYVMAKPGFRVAPDWTMGDVWKMQQEKKRWIPEVPAFPVQLPQNAIRATGAKVVLDCFMGSGTTAVAAVLEGADYIGIEQSARYCAVARERVASIPPAGEPVDPPALYTKSRPEPGRAELGGKAGVVYNAIREIIEAAGLHEITRSQVSLAQEIAMPLKTFRRAVEKIRTTRALIVTNRGASTGFALPMNVPNASDSATFVAPIKDGPMDGHMASESGPMAREDGPMAARWMATWLLKVARWRVMATWLLKVARWRVKMARWRVKMARWRVKMARWRVKMARWMATWLLKVARWRVKMARWRVKMARWMATWLLKVARWRVKMARWMATWLLKVARWRVKMARWTFPTG